MGYIVDYIVDYDELYSKERAANSKSVALSDSLGEVYLKADALKNSVFFQGKTADSVRSYIDEVHCTALTCIEWILETYKTRFFLYRDGYRSQIDSGLHTHINEDELSKVKSKFYTIVNDVFDVSNGLDGALQKINDLISLNNPSTTLLEEALERVITLCKELDNDISQYEEQHKQSDFTDIDNAIKALYQLVTTQLDDNKRVSVRDYQPNMRSQLTDMQTLAISMQAIQDYQQSVKETLTEALAREEQMLQDLKDERQWATWVATGICIVGAIALIAVTAGGATPLVCAAVGAGAGLVSAAATDFADNYVENGSLVEGMNWAEFGKDCLIGTVTGAIAGYGGAIAHGSSVVKPMERALMNTATGIVEKGSEGLIDTTFAVGAVIIGGGTFNEIMSAANDSTEKMLRNMTIGMATDYAGGYVSGVFDAHYVDKNFGQALFSKTMENMAEKEALFGTSVTWDVGVGLIKGKDSVEIISAVEDTLKETVTSFVKDEFTSAVSSGFDSAIDNKFKGNDTLSGTAAKITYNAVNTAVNSTAGGLTAGMVDQAMSGENIDLGKVWREDLGCGTTIAEDTVKGVAKDVTSEVYQDRKFENTLNQHDYDHNGRVDVVTFKDFSGYSVLKEDFDAAREVAGTTGYEGKRAQDILGVPRNVSFSDSNVEVHNYKISSLKKPDYSGQGKTNAIKVEHK